MSRDGTVACATCHAPERAFTDGKRVAVGVKGRAGRRNAPTLFNRGYGKAFFWDGRARTLEDQPLEAIQNPDEMDLTLVELEKRLNRLQELQQLQGTAKSRRSQKLNEIRGAERLQTLFWSEGGRSYRRRFVEVFGEAPTTTNAAKAIATYVRSLLSGNSPFDRFEHGDQGALSEAAKRGLQIFRGKGNCIACHSGPLLSDEDFHNSGVSWGKVPLDLGRYEVTKRDADRGKFKTPSLRNIALTAPYMHDGSLATLADKGAQPNPNLDREVRMLELSLREKEDLGEFLKSLSSAKPIQRDSSPASRR